MTPEGQQGLTPLRYFFLVLFPLFLFCQVRWEVEQALRLPIH